MIAMETKMRVKIKIKFIVTVEIMCCYYRNHVLLA